MFSAGIHCSRLACGHPKQVETAYNKTHEKKLKLFTEFRYAAGTWKYPRRVVARVKLNRDKPLPASAFKFDLYSHGTVSDIAVDRNSICRGNRRLGNKLVRIATAFLDDSNVSCNIQAGEIRKDIEPKEFNDNTRG